MGNLHKETQLIRGGAGIKTEAIWLCHHHCLAELSRYYAETASDLLVLIRSHLLSTSGVKVPAPHLAESSGLNSGV